MALLGPPAPAMMPLAIAPKIATPRRRSDHTRERVRSVTTPHSFQATDDRAAIGRRKRPDRSRGPTMKHETATHAMLGVVEVMRRSVALREDGHPDQRRPTETDAHIETSDYAAASGHPSRERGEHEAEARGGAPATLQEVST